MTDKRPWSQGPLRVVQQGQMWVVVGPGMWLAEFNSEADARLFAAAAQMYEVLKAYEQWEADLIMDDEAWAGGMAPFPTITGPLYDRMMELQAMRNAALRAANPEAFNNTVPASEPDGEIK